MADEATKKAITNWDKLNVDVQYQGRHITVPDDPERMPLPKAIEALQRKLRDEEQVFDVHEIIEAFPLDAAVAFVKALTNLYGWASPVPTPGFFGPKPPNFISVRVGPKTADVIQCPIGAFMVPGVDTPINVQLSPPFQFVIYTKVKKKDRHRVLEIAEETRRIVREESIYKGKAIRMKVDNGGDLMMGHPPEFIDVSKVSLDDILFDTHIQDQVNVNILAPITHTSACRDLKIPLKRGVLLHGKFGTGKTLLARVVAKIAQDNGWTFVLLDKVQGLRAALEFVNRYQPAAVFAEDIDRIAEHRDDDTNDLINVMDGVISKSAEVMTILTTNYVEKISKVILRPGRLDAIIPLRAPGPETVQKLVRMYAGRLLAKDASLVGAGEELAGQIPASIRECVERAKLAMTWRGDTKLADFDFVVSAQTMKNHLELLNEEQTKESVAEKLASSLKEVVTGQNGSGDHTTAESLHRIQGMVEDIHSHHGLA